MGVSVRKETADLPRLSPQCLLYFLLARSPPRPLNPPPRVILSQHSRIQPPGGGGGGAGKLLSRSLPASARHPQCRGAHTRAAQGAGEQCWLGQLPAAPGVPCSWELSLVSTQGLEDENGVPSLNSASPSETTRSFSGASGQDVKNFNHCSYVHSLTCTFWAG